MFSKKFTIGTKVYWLSIKSTNEEKTKFVSEIRSGIVLSSDSKKTRLETEEDGDGRIIKNTRSLYRSIIDLKIHSNLPLSIKEEKKLNRYHLC